MSTKMIDGVKINVNYANGNDEPVSDNEIKAYLPPKSRYERKAYA